MAKTSLKVTGLKNLIKKTQKLESNFERKTRKLIEELANLGIETARVRFQGAQYDGVNDVVVDNFKWAEDNKLVFIAKGNAVAFIEFGTGVTYTEQHPLATELGITRGSYGQGKGKQAKWGYYGEAGTNGKVKINRSGKPVVITKGNPPAKAMYEASKEMREKILEVARRVF